MKRILVTAAVLAIGAGTAGVSVAGTADGQGAQKRGLFVTDESNMGCNAATSTAAGSTNGFVLLNAPGKSGDTTKLLGEVSLKKAPGTYTVELVYNNGDCMPVGMLVTNAKGNGNFHVATPGSGGSYYVVLRNADSSAPSFATSPVVVR